MIENVFYSFILAHLIVKFEPIGWLMELIKPSKGEVKIFLYNMISLAFGCLKCCSLYIGFIIGGFWCGAITSFIAYIYSQLIAPFIDTIRFR